ncbi:hypothetical protein RND71_009523 [Anisodus tanguticus]|uniref:Uncharacterized protein n=1 Tax=Anisodus tanguticus TaxID=243964 RepID=A0AAE1SFK9_9SOLA|nr:hypothetical protein RND71_009523 [Anisodus tanguticus]
MIVVFGPGGGDFDVLILEDKDGVFEALLKAITNLFIYNALLSVDNFDRLYLKATIHNITKSKYGLSLFGFYFCIESHSADNVRVNALMVLWVSCGEKRKGIAIYTA